MKNRKNVNWMRNRSRILSVLLALVMALGPVQLALPVYAESPDSVPAAEVLSDDPITDPALDDPNADVLSGDPVTDPALGDPSADPALGDPVADPAPDGSDADPAPDGSDADVPSDVPDEDDIFDVLDEDVILDITDEEILSDVPDEVVPSDSLEPSDSPELSPVAAEKTVFTVVHHYPDEGDEAYPTAKAPEVQEDTDIAADAAPEEELSTQEEEPAAPEEELAAYPATGEISPDGSVYLYETGEEYPAPYVVLPEPKMDDDGNVLAAFSGFTVEKGDAAVTIKDEDPAAVCAEINYEPDTPQVVLHVYYGDTGIAPISIAPDEANAAAVKKYFVDNNFTGTYVTGRQEEGQSYDRWSIVIKEDGDVALYFDGEDTGATATFNGVTSGKPKEIVFSHEDWYLNETAETDAKLTVTLDSNGCFTMPDTALYWDQDEDGELQDFSFSKALHYYNETILKDYFKNFQGVYTLPDGSDWKVNISADGEFTMSGKEAENAFVDYFTMNSSRKTFTAVVFTSPDWYNNKKVAYQQLKLNWTAVTSNKTYNFFKISANTTFYESDGKAVVKGFNQHSYFMPADGMFSYDYFAGTDEDDNYKYVGTYSLSEAYGTVYGGDIDGIGGWYIEVAENGHVYLHTGEGEDNKREAVATAGSTGPDRVTTMYVCVPGWYTEKTCATPAFIELTWANNSTAKAADLYFTTDGLATAYKPQEGGTGVKTFIPPMRFESSKRAEFAKGKLGAADEDGNPLYVNKYIVNDESGEYIEIEEDGSVKLYIPKKGVEDGYDVYTPLYYNIDAKWLTKTDEAAVTSVVFSTPNWFGDKNKKSAETDRQTVTMTWNATNLQFTAEEKTCYEPGSDTVVRTYTVNTKYNLAAINAEAEAYFSQYVHGEYTLNDGSGWKVKVDKDETGEWRIYTDFDGNDTEDYEAVENPAPVFAYDKSHTSSSTSTTNGEWGNDGRYLANITVPVKGWYTDEACTRKAIVTLNWKGGVTNPMDDHQFNVESIALYRNIDGEVECKYLVGTFYSDADRAKGQDFLKSLGIAGTYQPTAAKGKWWIVIDGEGKVTVHATDSQRGEHTISDVAMDITMDKKTPSNGVNPNFGSISAVTHVKVVIPQWRTAGTNESLANIYKCAEITFTFVTGDNGSSYFTPSNAYIYNDTKEDRSPWVVAAKGKAGYDKTLSTKLYENDRAYSDANKEKAKEYFKTHAGTYRIDEASLDYEITITDEGEIYWGDLTSDKEPLPADVQFDAIRDDNENDKVDDGEETVVPGTISVWLNGYCTGSYTASSKDPYYTDGTQRADLTWRETNEKDTKDTANTFKSSGKSNVKGYIPGTKTYETFSPEKYYILEKDDVEEGWVFTTPGTYETTDAEFKIVVETDESDNTTYNFYRPDLSDTPYPLKCFGSGDTAYLRGKIGRMKKNDVYLVVTKVPEEGFENFLFTAYEVTYNDLGGKETTSSSAPTVTLPAWTRFTDYSKVTTGKGPFIVAHEGEDKDEGTRYSRLSLALHELEDGDTIYLEEDVQIGFEAKLPDNVGNVTIDGQGHTITRDSYKNPTTALAMISDETLTEILSDPRIDPDLVLMALEEASADGKDLPEKHYTGAILQVGAGDEVTLKNVTIDGEGKWQINEEKLEYDKQLNKDYDINVLDDPNGGHPIDELPGNVTSTDSLIKVAGGTLILYDVILENFYAGDGYDDDRHFIDFMSTEDGKLEILSETVFKHNASRSGVCIGNTDLCKIDLSNCTTMQNNYCYGGNGGLIVAMEGTQVYMSEGTSITDNVAADTNGIFIQLHKKNDGVKDGDNKGDIYSKLHMDGGYIHNNIGLRGGSYGWGQTIYLYNGGSFEMNGGDICCNIGAGISSIYQQPSADALKLNAGHIHNNTCSLKDEGTDWALDIALMNIGDMGPEMVIEQNFVVGAAAILGGYASGDEYLTNEGVINGNISVYSYFNNEGNVSTVENRNTINGDIRLENGSMVKNTESGKINGNVTIRPSLTESAGEASFHNEGEVTGNVDIAENTHFYNSGEVYGNITVKSGGTLELNCNEKDHEPHGGTVHGNVTVYPDGLIYAEVTPTEIDGIITFEYEDEEEIERMKEVLEDSGITCTEVIYKKHVHTVSVTDTGDVQGEWDETTIDPGDNNKCTDPWIIQYTCKTCGKVVVTKENELTGYHDYYVYSTDEATCEKGAVEHIRCNNCAAYNSSSTELKVQVSDPLGHEYKELEELYIPPTTYGSGHLYYVCTRCGKLLEFEIDEVSAGAHKHSFQNDDGSLNTEAEGVTIEPATCEEPGKITFECQDGCGTKIEFEIPKTGHKYPDPRDADYGKNYEKIEHVESTCATAGYDRYAPKCTVCGKTAEKSEDGKTVLTIQVNLPKLEHKWTDWANVDDGTYICTAERKQERHCENCDTAKEERIGGEKNHTWDADHVTCTVCGYTTNGHHIDYRLNGGTAPASLTQNAGKAYTPGDEITLWQPTAGEAWTKQTATSQAVFVGWSETDLGAAPHEKKPDATFVSSVVIPEDADAIIFAVWAADKNKNGKADYNEDTISINYDKNGGTGTVPESLTGVLPGAAYPLETAPDLEKDGNIFAGWSMTKHATVITTAADSEEIIKSLVSSPFNVPVGVGDIMLYAVYAEDNNGNGKPDYCEDALHVEYYINGGKVHDGYTVEDSGMFYVCNDYHKPGEDAELLAVEYGAMMIYLENAVLIGWSQDPHAARVTSEEEANGLSITKVSLTGAESNAKVYALWADDVNGNNIADYKESTLTHTYHRNEYLSNNSGTTLKLGEHLNIIDEDSEPISEPERQRGILPGMSVELAANDYFGSADLVDGKGNVEGRYIQVGWSQYSHGACMSKTDYNNWVIGVNDADGYTEDGKYYRYLFDSRDENAYAVWAIDNNQNGVADFRELHYTITLDVNGGTVGNDFQHQTVLDENDTFTFPAGPTKAGYTFKGWSADGGETLYRAGDIITVTGDATYFALYDATTFTVTLDLNGGNGGDDFTAESPVNEGESFTFPADPTKAGFTFLGWSAEGDENLYKAGDTVTVTADVTYIAQYDAITRTVTHTVTLDLDGGTAGEGFAESSTVNEGESFTFPADPTKEGYTFLGWSADGGETLYKAGDTVTVAADVTFTAQWNASGTGETSSPGDGSGTGETSAPTDGSGTPTGTPSSTDGSGTPTGTPSSTDGSGTSTDTPSSTDGSGTTTDTSATTDDPDETSETSFSSVSGGSGDSGDSGGSVSPTTGDDTSILPWLALLLMSGACLVALVRKKRLF